ncbi:hypothetical protein K440DRAFT_660603 [Wilcoxina mikolae CBS 423.85]|nr:hypothetical protein K440DRAFT_660603 [Wilcoxina mikolae CBS 423.85]
MIRFIKQMAIHNRPTTHHRPTTLHRPIVHRLNQQRLFSDDFQVQDETEKNNGETVKENQDVQDKNKSELYSIVTERIGRLEGVVEHGLTARFDRMEKRFDRMDTRFDQTDTKIEYNRKETLGLIMFLVGTCIIGGSFKIFSFDDKRQKEVTDTLKEIKNTQTVAAVSHAKTTAQLEALGEAMNRLQEAQNMIIAKLG